MNESQLASALGGAKTSTAAFLAAHPVSVAIIGGALVGVGAYYATKAFVARRNNKEDATPEAAAEPAAA